MRAPVSFPQLCLVAKEQLLTDPSIDNGEWAERIKQRLVRLRLGYPEQPHQMTAAMEAVERALAKEGWPRPKPAPRTPSAAPTNIRPLSHDEAQQAIRQYGALGVLKSMPKVPRFTQHQADSLRVIRMLKAAALESETRCRELERIAAAAILAEVDKAAATPPKEPDV